MFSIHAYDTYFVDLQARYVCIIYIYTLKITSSIGKDIGVNAKMRTHSVVYSDNMYPMFYVYLCVCVCMYLGWKGKKTFTHAQEL